MKQPCDRANLRHSELFRCGRGDIFVAFLFRYRRHEPLTIVNELLYTRIPSMSKQREIEYGQRPKKNKQQKRCARKRFAMIGGSKSHAPPSIRLIDYSPPLYECNTLSPLRFLSVFFSLLTRRSTPGTILKPWENAVVKHFFLSSPLPEGFKLAVSVNYSSALTAYRISRAVVFVGIDFSYA